MDQTVQESYYTAQMLEEVPIGIALLDARDFHIITANQCFRTLFANTLLERKYTEQSLEQANELDFFSAPSLPFALDLFRSVTQTGQGYQGQEFPVLHPERGMTYWNGTITPVRNPHGQIEQLLITASDVTEQTRARLDAESKQQAPHIDTEIQRLAAMEAVASCVSKELVSENIARVAIEALVTTLNPICVCIHLAQPLKQELHLAHMYIDKRDQAAENLQQMVNNLQRVAYDSPHWIARARHHHEPILLPDLHHIPRIPGEQPAHQLIHGGYICIPLWFKEHYEGTLVVFFREAFSANGLLVRILQDCSTCISAALAHSRLLSEVERERVRLRAVLDYLPEGIFLVEASDKCISYANEAAAHIINIPREYFLGISLERVYNARHRRFSLTNKGQEVQNSEIPLLRALEGETIVGQEVQFVRPDDKLITLLVAVAPIWNKAGTITGAVSIFQDITLRKSIEQQKNDFLSIASHELRTPTTAIQGFAEILQMFAEQPHEPDTSHTTQIIASILEQSTRLTRLIDEMLDISQIEHRQLRLHVAQHDLITTVKRAIKDIAVTDRQRVITLALQGIEADEALPGVFDEERIFQVLSNLISNAMKYSQPESAIEVGLRYDQVQPGSAYLWVRDSGIGIPSDDLPYIFDRFHRARNFDHSISGLGIGLYLAREVMLRHGGSIQADSQEGKGSTFSLELPLYATESKD